MLTGMPAPIRQILSLKRVLSPRKPAYARVMAKVKIVLTVPGGRADLSRTAAQWLGEHLPPAAMLRSQLKPANEQDIEGAYIDVIEISYAERDAVKQAILGARGRAETVPDDVSALERIL